MAGEPSDPLLWLEDIDGKEACAWADARNAETITALCDARFERDREGLLRILNAPDRIAWITLRGGFVYNFWQDDENPKGLWRRTTLADYRSGDPAWETLLDVDALGRAEGEDWVWRGAVTLPPTHRHVLVSLSRGGADATVVREFDLVARAFVENGFVLPEAKGGAAWLDADTLLVSSAFGGDRFETASGYARTVRRWQRGTPFEAAAVVFECDRSDMSAWGWREHSPRDPRTLFVRRPDFFRQVLYVEDRDGSHRNVELPGDVYFYIEGNWLALDLRSEWTVAGRRYPAGALLVTDLGAFMAGGRDFTVLFEPTPTSSLDGFQIAGNVVAFKVLDQVRSRIMFARFEDRTWRTEPLAGFPDMATVDVYRLCEDDIEHPGGAEEGETFVVSSQSSVVPPTLSLARFGASVEQVTQAPARFDATGLAITQHHATSADGTRIPYFQIARAGLPLDGTNPCLMTGYGGFQIALLPNYAPAVGKLWLERGGTFVIANIRGGGEFGPDWHKAGMRAGKKRSHDDFAAVAKDLTARRVTRRERLACVGGSNGGLLVGNMLTRYPDLFGAIVCAVPLLDMQRYTKLTAGPSWMAEYGDPDNPDDWAFLREISAYQAVAAGRDYPPILLTTSRRDDRVHPGHARKAAAKLQELGYRASFYEQPQGGHAGAADNAHIAFNQALVYAFLRKTIAPEMAGAGA
jgi:prolyl oligopeptidase